MAVGLFFAAVFSVVETILHRERLRPWLAWPYFFLLGVGSAAFAFAVVNAILAVGASTREAQGWFELFFQIGFIAGTGIAVCCGIVAAILRKRLSMIKVLGGTAILFCALAGLLAWSAAHPSLNWW